MIAIALVLGMLLASGLLATASPWLWPKSTVQAPRFVAQFGTTLALAGFRKLSVVKFIWISVLVGIGATMVTFAMTGVVIVSALSLIVGTAAPFLIVAQRAEQRRLALTLLWPDVVDHLIGSLRAGLGLPDAVCVLATNGPVQLRPEFAEFERQYRRSGSWSIALNELKSRCADATADRLCEILRLAREVGGADLVSVLRALGEYLRQDVATSSELRARQSWVTNAARLGVVAPWIVLVLLCLRPEARAAYNAPGGILLIGIGFAVSVLAYHIMRSIGRFRPERRWAES